MKKFFITLVLLLAIGSLANSQSTDPLVTSCISNAGADAKYLKDFRVQLGKAASPGEYRYKAQMSLWKNTKYRFSMCNSDDSKGKLVLLIKDDANKTILSSFDAKTGKSYSFIDFECNKSGIYQLSYDFTDGEQGSGVGVISMVK
jgi:hypothetical protein